MSKNRLLEHEPEPHDHHEHPDAILRPQALKRLKITFFIGLSLFVLEFFGGLYTSSLALLADSYHVLGDLAAVGVTILASYLAERLKSKKRSYGYYRLEVIAALFNGCLLSFLAASIVKSALHRLEGGHEVHANPMLIIACVGLGINLLMLYVLHSAHRHNINIRSAYMHMVGDSLSSVVVILSALGINYLGINWLDAAGGLVVALILTIMSIRLIWDSIHVLLEGTPKHMDPEEIEAQLKTSFPQIVDIHDFHIWEITSHLFAMTAHVEARVHSLEDTHQLIDGMNSLIKQKYGIGHTTFQVEPTLSD